MGHKGSKHKKGKHTTTEEHDELGHILEGVPKKHVDVKNQRMSVEKQNIDNHKKSGSEIRQEIVPNSEIGDQLKKVPIFARLFKEQRAVLGGALLQTTFECGQAIFNQGEKGEAFYIIVEGECEVTRHKGEEEKEIHLADLGVGDYFGEASLLTSELRTATVKAVQGGVTVLFLERDAFEALFIGEENTARIVVPWATRRAAISAEQNTDTVHHLVAPSAESKVKTDDDKAFITGALLDQKNASSVFFEELPQQHLRQIIDEMYKVSFAKDASALQKDVMNYRLYIVASGNFEEVTEEDELKHGPGGVFGAVALMHAHDQNSIVTALEDSTCWAIDRFKFQSIAKSLGQGQLERYKTFLAGIDLLSPLSSFERLKIAEALVEHVYKPNEVIFNQGDDGQELFIVEEGKVAINQTKEGADSTHLCDYGYGEYFGEKALLSNDKRAASAVAGGEGCTVVKIDRAAFSLLVGPLEEIFKTRIASYEKSTKKKHHAWKPIGVDFQSWDVLGTLGKGSFGFVSLIKAKSGNAKIDGKYFALKAVSKYTVKKTKQEGHIMSEKTTMMELNHPCLINLVQTYNTQEQLFFLLEAGMGGDLFTVLRRNRLFDEHTAKFYCASVVAGFEFMHSCNTIYRDLKPENLLLDDLGFLKITDFGFAKKITGKTWTLCGTPEYLAPEIVAGRGHGFGVDWWTVGILNYELLAGYTPFYDRDQMLMYRKIARGKFTFPSHMSREARDLIKELLTLQPTTRLGVIKGGAKLIKQHPYFNGFDWSKLVMRRLKPPIKPVVKNKKNLSKEQPPKPHAYNPAPGEEDLFADF